MNPNRIPRTEITRKRAVLRVVIKKIKVKGFKLGISNFEKSQETTKIKEIERISNQKDLLNIRSKNGKMTNQYG